MQRQQPEWVERQRLLRSLDENLPDHLVWLVAAGGYGKTTLAEHYFATGGPAVPLSGLEIGGPGELFYQLRQRAMEVRGQEAGALPLLPPESSAAPQAFARHFARRWLELPAAHTPLFIDDLHHLDADSPLHAVLALFAEQLVAAGVAVVVASRTEPPAAWVRLRCQGRLTVIDEQQLAFTAEESKALLRQAGVPVASSDSSRLDGWPAGLRLLIEHQRRQGGPLRDTHLPQRPLNDWFGAEVFDPLPETDRELLRQVAWPRRIPAGVLDELLGRGSREQLDRLHHHHAFVRVETDPEQGPCYRLHDLFRDFLCLKARQHWSESEVTEAQQRWGWALWQRGDLAEGAQLLIAAGDHASLARGLAEQGGLLLQTGRGDQLFQWLQALPEETVAADPHLNLWLGLCLTLADTRLARGILARSWEGFQSAGDHLHLALAWGGIVDSIWLEWAHVSEYEPWVEALYSVEDQLRANLPRPIWLRVLRGMLTALGHSRPWDADLDRWQREAMNALSEDAPADEKLMLASQLMYLNTWQFGRRAPAAHVIGVMRQCPKLIDQASPLPRCLWSTFESLWELLYEGDYEACLAEAERGRALIREHGIGTWDNAVPPLHAALCFHDSATLDDWVAWFMRTELKAHRPFYDTFQAHFLSAQAWLKGHTAEALDHAERATIAMARHGSIAISAGFSAIHAALLSEAGHPAAALREAARAHHTHNAFDSAFVDVMVYLTLARIPLHRGQPRRALPYLRRAFASGARERLFFPLLIRDEELARLCALALEHGIEPDYARWLIRARRLAPPKDPALRLVWPWDCRLLVLGRFDTALPDGTVKRISQRRVRALLSNLIQAGPEGLPQQQLAATLWPDSEDDKALNNLHVTAHRFRELLDRPHALLVESGRVRLNPQCVWVDAWELAALARHPGDLSDTDLADALDHYRGPPQLEGIEDAARTIQEESLERAYASLVRIRADRLAAEDAGQALELLRQALHHLPLDSDLWAGVLRCQAALESRRALEQTWQRIERLYVDQVDSPPPSKLQDLYRALL